MDAAAQEQVVSEHTCELNQTLGSLATGEFIELDEPQQVTNYSLHIAEWDQHITAN